MYSIDLGAISLDEFETIIANTELSSGRRILAFNVSNIMNRLKDRDINDLGALQQMLQNKKRYPQLSAELFVSTEYLDVLNREVNGYVAKPLPLATLGVFAEDELSRLHHVGIKSTKTLYECCFTKAARQELVTHLALAEEHLTVALELSDLMRINGVGPVFAKFLRAAGIHSSVDFCNTDARVIWERFQQINADQHFTKVKLSPKDVEYCKRFCKKLSVDVEW